MHPALIAFVPALLVAGGVAAVNDRALREAEAEARQTAGEMAELGSRRDARGRVAADLAAGRVGVWEAADLLAAIDGRVAGWTDGLRRRFPDAASDRERYARRVVELAGESVGGPRRQVALTARLAADLGTAPE